MSTGTHPTPSLAGEERPLVPRRPIMESAEMDVTPLIDITFLLLIFFIVTTQPDVQTALSLPKASHGVAVSARSSVVISVANAGDGRGQVYLADGRVEEAAIGGDADAQEQQIIDFVLEGRAEGKTNVLLKAEKGVRHREVARVAEAIGQVEDMPLNLAIIDAD